MSVMSVMSVVSFVSLLSVVSVVSVVSVMSVVSFSNVVRVLSFMSVVCVVHRGVCVRVSECCEIHECPRCPQEPDISNPIVLSSAFPCSLYKIVYPTPTNSILIR